MCQSHTKAPVKKETPVNQINTSTVLGSTNNPSLEPHKTDLANALEKNNIGPTVRSFLLEEALPHYTTLSPEQKYSYMAGIITNHYTQKMSIAYAGGKISEGDTLNQEMGTKLQDIRKEIFG